MSNRSATWLIGILAGLVVMTAFAVVPGVSYSPEVSGYGRAMAANENVIVPTDTSIEDFVTLWEFKVGPNLLEPARLGSKALQDVTIYTRNMRELSPLLDLYGISMFPEEFRGMAQRDVARLRGADEGIVSTRALLPGSAIAAIAKLPGVIAMEKRLAPQTLDYSGLPLTEAQDRLQELRGTMQGPPGDIAPTDWGSFLAHNVSEAAAAGFSGMGVNVAVQDWGLDFATPNLMGQWATVTDAGSPYFGYPIMHSQHSQWNNLELFTAASDFDRAPYPHFFTFGTASWYADTSYRATKNATGHVNYTTGSEYGLFQFTKRNGPTVDDLSVMDRSYFVGAAGDLFEIVSASGWYHLGVNKDMNLEVFMGERPGILVVDSTTPFVYDTVYVDVDNDKNFTNDKPVTVTGDPLSGMDIDGDGLYDLSGGLLYFIATQTGAIAGEIVIAVALGTESAAALVNGWIETDVDGFSLFTATLALDGMYWPSAGEDIIEVVIADTTGLGDETGTTASLTAGSNGLTNAAVDTAALLQNYDLWLIYDAFLENNTDPLDVIGLVEGTDFSIDMSTGEITWLADLPVGYNVQFIYQFNTWILDYNTGAITFQAPPLAGSGVTATYNTGLAVPYSDTTATRQAWDLYVPGPGDLVVFHGAFEAAASYDHGTFVGSMVAGIPVATDLFGEPLVWGSASEAKLIGVDLPTSFDLAELFRFSAYGYDGVPGTGDEANIITNSWGFTQALESGFTNLERYLYDLTTVQTPEVTVLFAAGNNGPGYGTVGTPDSSPGVISVGAGTQMNYRWLIGSDGGEAYYDWPVSGSGVFGVGPFGDIADFSSRGPSLMGDHGPDVFAAGAFVFGAYPLNLVPLDFGIPPNGTSAWNLAGGTSFATPLTTGVTALIYEAYTAATGSPPTSWVAKDILMSSANDHGWDVLQQGAGWVNASAAVDLARSTAGIRVSPGSLRPGTYNGVHRPAFVNMIDPGDSYTETLTVYNEGAGMVSVTIDDAVYTKIVSDYTFTWDFSTPWPSRDYRILKPTGLYAADGITAIELIDLSTGWNNADFIRITFERDPAVLSGTPYTYIEPFDWYDFVHTVGGTLGVYDGSETEELIEVLNASDSFELANQDLVPSSWTVYLNGTVWPDGGGANWTIDDLNGTFTLIINLNPADVVEIDYQWDGPGFDDFDERNRFGFYGIQNGATSVTAQLFDPASRVHDGLAISFRDIANAFGLTPVTVEFYGKADWTWADAEIATGLMVPAGGMATFDVTFTVPTDTQAGTYQGAVRVQDGSLSVIVPVVITVAHSPASALFLAGGTPATTLYDNNGIFQGAVSNGPWRNIGDNRRFLADFTALPAANRRMIQSLSLRDAPSEGDLILFQLQPDPTWTDDATYGPGRLVEVAATAETFGSSGAAAINAELLASDVFSGPIAIQMRGFNALTADQPFSLEVGTMDTNPIEPRISSNQLAGSVPISVTANVPLNDGLFVLSFQQLPGDGVLTSEDPIIASSTTPTAVESVSVPNLAENVYFIATHGWSVPTSPTTFDITIEIIAPSGTTVEMFTGLLVSQDDPGDPYTSSNVIIRSLEAGTTLNVDVVGTGISDDLDLYVMADAAEFIIGAGNFLGPAAPTATVPGNTGTGFDLEWVFAGGQLEGIVLDTVFVNPGFAPLVETQSLDIVFSYDLTPPSFSAHLPAPGAVIAESPPGIFVQIDDSQPGSIARAGEIDEGTIRVWLDGEDITSVASISVVPVTNQGYRTGAVLFVPGTPLSDGPHTMLVQAGDFAGNLATTTWTFTVDTSAPALAITSPAADLATSSATITVAGTTDPGAAVTVSGQSVSVDLAGQFSTTITLSQGENVIEVTATDAVGNVAVDSRVVTLDATAPAISQLRSSAGLLTNGDVSVISGVVDEPVSLTVAGGDVTVRADGSFEATVALIEGSNAIAIVATDAAGNQGSSSLTIVRDSTPPILTLDALPSETASATVTVSGTVESGINFVTVNGQPVPVTAGAFSTDVALSFGSNEIFVEATDAAGNSKAIAAAVSFVPSGVTVASVGLILLPILAVVALVLGLVIGGMRMRGGRPPAMGPPKEEGGT